MSRAARIATAAAPTKMPFHIATGRRNFRVSASIFPAIQK
jgi:hypothetical protein